jgi:uncharacterized protein (DUF433 family)
MKKIVIDPKRRHGKPIIEGTRITVVEVLGALASGMTFKDIEQDYGVTPDGIRAALQYATETLSEEEFGILQIQK